MNHQIYVLDGPDRGRTLQISAAQVTSIGRGQACDHIISDPHMSRVHALIEFRDGCPYLVDAGSTGGTYVGDRRVSEHLLRQGDTFRIGGTSLRYMMETSTNATTLGAGFRNPPPAKTPNIEGLVGERITEFELEAILARGSSGVVYGGKDIVKNRMVAVKVLIPDLVRGEEQKERFIRAMKTMLPIRHPHIVRLYNAGKKGQFCWAAMEFVDGESLTKVIQRIGVQNMLD